MGACRGDGNRRLVPSATGLSRDFDRSGRLAAPLSENDDRAAGKEVGGRLRLDIAAKAENLTSIPVSTGVSM